MKFTRDCKYFDMNETQLTTINPLLLLVINNKKANMNIIRKLWAFTIIPKINKTELFNEINEREIKAELKINCLTEKQQKDLLKLFTTNRNIIINTFGIFYHHTKRPYQFRVGPYVKLRQSINN